MLSYVRQRALLSEPAYLLWNEIGSIFFLQFDLGFFGHFVGGEAAGGRQKTLRLLSPKGELENLWASYPQNGPALGSVLPTECAEDEVHDKEGAEEDEGAEVDPGPRRPARVQHLTTGQKAQGRKTKTNKKQKTEKKKNGARGSKKG